MTVYSVNGGIQSDGQARYEIVSQYTTWVARTVPVIVNGETDQVWRLGNALMCCQCYGMWIPATHSIDTSIPFKDSEPAYISYCEDRPRIPFTAHDPAWMTISDIVAYIESL